MTKLKKTALATIVLLVLGCTAFLYNTLDSSLDMLVKPDFSESRSVEKSYSRLQRNHPQSYAWADSLKRAGALKDTFIVADDGRRLHAIYAKAPQETDKTAVLLHGWTNSAVMFLHYAYAFQHGLGYNVLLPDLNGHGQSDGEAAQMGWFDRLDALRWMDVANDLFAVTDSATQMERNTRMAVFGVSMGAATTMCVSGEPQKPYVKAFVEDCGYTDVREQVLANPEAQGFKRHFISLLSWLCRMKYGWGFKEASPLNQVGKSTLPMLFIHGDGDDFVPTRMVYPLYEAKTGDKELWVAPGSKHAKTYDDYPEEYVERLGRFLGKYIR